MGKNIDFIIKKDQNIVAYVEVKNKSQFSIEDAKRLRSNLMNDHLSPLSEYFLLVSQDHGYLWSNSSGNLEEPAYTFPMTSVVERYFKTKKQEKRLRNTELELIVYQWLNDLTFKPANEQYTTEPEKSLYESGFIEMVHSAHVTLEDEL